MLTKWKGWKTKAQTLEVRLVVTAGKQKVALESETAKHQPNWQLKKRQKKQRKLKTQTQVKESGQARWGEVDEEANSGGGRLTTSLWRIHASVTEEVGMLLTLLLINCRVPGLYEYLLPLQNMDVFYFYNLKCKVWRMTELQGVIRCIQFEVNLNNRCSKTYYLMSKLYKRIGKH